MRWEDGIDSDMMERLPHHVQEKIWEDRNSQDFNSAQTHSNSGMDDARSRQMNAPASNKPSFNLKMKGEDGKLVNLTGLFEGETKAGVRRLSGFDKNSDIGYSLLPATDKKTGQETGELSLSFKEGKDGKFQALCKLKPMTSKSGEEFYAGKTQDGTEYVMYKYQPKVEQKGFSPRPQAQAQAPGRGAPKSPAAPQPRRSFGPPTRA